MDAILPAHRGYLDRDASSQSINRRRRSVAYPLTRPDAAVASDQRHTPAALDVVDEDGEREERHDRGPDPLEGDGRDGG
jgi:hypothetical protein